MRFFTLKKTIGLLGILLCFILTAIPALSQTNVIQFTGIVVGGDSLYGIPNVAVYVTKTGRGVFTNEVGYFSLPALSGDTVNIKALGFQERNIVVPDTSDKVSLIIQLEIDTLVLPEIVLWPYPDFQSFKKAFLALELESRHQDYAAKNLDAELLRRMVYNSGASANMNQRYFMYQQANRQMRKYSSPAYLYNFLNPFAWAKFIKDVKSGGLRNKQWEEIEKHKHENDD